MFLFATFHQRRILDTGTSSVSIHSREDSIRHTLNQTAIETSRLKMERSKHIVLSLRDGASFTEEQTRLPPYYSIVLVPLLIARPLSAFTPQQEMAPAALSARERRRLRCGRAGFDSKLFLTIALSDSVETDAESSYFNLQLVFLHCDDV